MPPEQKNIGTQGPSSKKIVTLIALVVGVLIVVVGLTSLFSSDRAGDDQGIVPNDKERVTVQKVDLKSVSSEAEKIPQGLPSYIPVETKDAYESYVMNYEDRNVTQYSVSYMTTSAPSVKYKEYLDVMTKNGFVFGKDGKNESQGFLYGTKDNDDLTIVISKSGNKTSVQISFLDRQ